MSTEPVASVVRLLGDLAPSGRAGPAHRDWVTVPAVWIATDSAHVFNAADGPEGPYSLQPEHAVVVPGSTALRRLAARDRIDPDEHALRLGWAWLAGSIDTRARRLRVVTPLLSVPVRIKHTMLEYRVVGVGDPVLTPLVEDADTASRLEMDAHFGGGALSRDSPPELVDRLTDLQHWVRDVVRAAGVRGPVPVLGPSENPLDHAGGDGLVVVAGYGLYYSGDLAPMTIAATLEQWATVAAIDRTAFAGLYFPEADDHGDALSDEADVDAEPLLSPLVLTGAQEDVVRRARVERVVAVSGAPGNGKSHSAMAVALDAIARGEHVLVATRSIDAAAVLTDLLDRQPGPTPVVFGSAENREAIANRLAEGADRHRQPTADLGALRERYRHAVAVRQSVCDVLDREATADRDADPDAVSLLRVEVPATFDVDADLDALDALDAMLQAAAGTGGGWLARRRRRRAEATVRARLDPSRQIPLADLRSAVATARRRRTAATLDAAGGTSLDDVWAALAASDHDVRAAFGEALQAKADVARSAGGDSRRAIAGLARALRAGRASRRAILADLDGSALLDALPLWIGTLSDIDDLLPPVAGLFDLVILDEASQIDQVQAATALLRADRAVIVGDPHQLRQVSFAAEADISRAISARGLDGLADRLDVRRMSIFDVAAAATPVTWLDEHHRSVPHLIEFSARHFYPQPIYISTRHPRNECLDAIDIVKVDGARDATGVDAVEIDAVMAQLASLRVAGASSVGVATPFRAQADAIQQRVLDTLPLEDVEALDLRVTTAHGFQGDERDVVVLSLGLGPADVSEARGFVEDPNLFNVLVTRARRRMIVITSLDASVGRLLGEFLTHADRAPVAPGDGPVRSPWTAALGAELRREGFAVRTGYPVGRWTVDLCVGEGEGACGAMCDVHPDGSDAHVRRQLDLMAAGWRLVDAFPSRWSADAARAAVELHQRLTS